MLHEEIKIYENRGDVTLTTYVLDNSRDMLDGKKRPAILICPGGGYLNCSDREGEPVAMTFAAMGYHAFVLRYSVYGEGKPVFLGGKTALARKENCIYPVQMREIAQAMLVIRERSDEWHVDSDKIVLCGFSAGAHNCAMYATHWHMPVIQECFKVKSEWLRPAACILGYMISDLVLLSEETRAKGNRFAPTLFNAMNITLFGEKDVEEHILADASPAGNVSEFMLPTFLWATAGDDLVPVQQTLHMAEALAVKNIPFELHIFEEGSHGLSLSSQASAAAWSQTNPDAEKWIGHVDTWLKKRFALDLPNYTKLEEMMRTSGML